MSSIINPQTNTMVSSQGFEYGVKHFYNQKSGSISEILFDSIQLSQTDISALLKLGAIYINNERQLNNNIISANNLFRVHTKPRRYNCNYNWSSLIVYENSDFLVINKPSGVPSHPSVDNVIENSLTQLSLASGVPLFITHRLDTLTSGLIVYAKNTAFVKSFNKQLQEKTIEKKYVALVEATHALPKKVIHYMEPSKRAPKNVSESFVEGWAFCELDILSQKKFSHDLSHLKINLLTGRTHQIRSQLSNLQAPITGDILYGAKQDYQPQTLTPAIALRACELEFNWGTERLRFNLSEELEP
ncbi:MAG: RluA family pseudouridine synthase [Bdellovibrionota bacterium]